jgi:4-hydroxy-tetrahydrodipicolinate synthase
MGAFRGPKDWGTVLTAMLTPFDADGAVNYAEAARLAAYLVDEQGNSGLVINGTTGESPTLKEEERLKLLEVALDTVGDRAAVVFGAGSYDTDESIAATRAGEKHGAHGIMLVNPYYSRPSQAGLYAHFSAIAKETSLPVMVYNIIPRSAVNLETPTLLRLIEIENIVAVKEASGNISQIQDVCAQAPEGFRVYSGDDAITLPVLAVGGHGIVSVAAHIEGKKIRQMVDAFHAGDLVTARALHHSLLPVYKAIFSYPSPVPIKYLTSMKGFDCETVRLPLVTLTEAEKNNVRSRLP